MRVLPKYYRFKVLNQTGVSIASGNIKVYARRVKFDSTGQLDYESAEDTVFTSSGSLANGAYQASSMLDNSSDLWIGGTFVIEVTLTGSPNGNVILFLERSTDGSTNVDSNGVGDIVAVINFTSATTKRKSFSL